MAQLQRQADVHYDELCPPNKRYALMNANKKIDLDNPLCPNESKIVANIIQNHPLRFSIVASSSVPWIYLCRYITAYPDISKSVRDKYHILEHDEMVKSIFNSWKNKAGLGMKIPSWMTTDEMKLTENYRMQKISELRTYVMGESLTGQANESKPGPSTSVIQSCQRDPKAPALSLVNQDLLYLKKGNSGSKEYVLSLHKFSTVIFPDDDIKERTSRWRQQEQGNSIEEVYSNLKIVQVIKTTGELGHEHKFVTEIIARRANGCIISINEPDYKNLNKNDIEDISIMIWERVYDFQLGVENYQHKVNLTAPTISFPGIKKKNMFSIVSEPIYSIIYKNKKKRVMGHQEIHKFYNATPKRILEGLKSYNNVKHGYVTPSLSKEDAEYHRLFKEEIEERLKHRDQMRRWKMYLNGRPLGSRRSNIASASFPDLLLALSDVLISFPELLLS
nr:hypothetical protein [Tanacetum cinerariifolium]